MNRLILTLIILIATPLTYAARSHVDPADAEDAVIARIHTTDSDRIAAIGRQYDLLYYIWKAGYAVIRAPEHQLPEDAVIDLASTAELKTATTPFRGTGTIPDRPCYRTVEQTFADLEAQVASFPMLAHWVDFGDSWEKTQGEGGYDLRALVLTNQSIPGPKPVFMVVGASHARELTTAESVTRFAEGLLSGYESDPDIHWMLDHFEVHVIPHHNPDGRKMAEAECSGGCFPGWRKNTNQAYCGAGSSSRGADLNRNSGSSFWGGPFSGSSQCGDTYRGPSATSEPENAALEAYIDAVFPDYRSVPSNDYTTPADMNADGVFISVHSAGDIAFYPWEGSNDDPPNLAGLRSMAQKIGFASSFAACQNCFLGPASGTNVDYVYETRGIPSFTFETGSSFGETCQAYENTVLPQTLAGLTTALRNTHRSYQSPQGPDIVDVTFTTNISGGLLQAMADDTRRAVNGGGEPLWPGQPVSEVRYTIDQPPWLAPQSFPMLPQDGSFDTPVEAATAELSNAQINGASLVFVYAVDTGGNQGPPTAVWLPQDSLNFGSGFEPAP